MTSSPVLISLGQLRTAVWVRVLASVTIVGLTSLVWVSARPGQYLTAVIASLVGVASVVELLVSAPKLVRAHRVRSLAMRRDALLEDAARDAATRRVQIVADDLQASRREVGDRHPHTLRLASQHALLVAQSGRAAEAMILLDEVFDVQRHILGENHRKTLRTRTHMWTISPFTNPTRIRRALDELADAQLEALGERDADLFATRRLLVTLDPSDPDGVLRLEQLWLAEREVLGDTHPESVRTLAALAQDLLWLDPTGVAARRLLVDHVAHVHGLSDDDDPVEAFALRVRMASMLCSVGGHREAADVLGLVHADQTAAFGIDHADTLHTACLWSRALAESGETDRAGRVAVEATAIGRRVLAADDPLLIALTTQERLCQALRDGLERHLIGSLVRRFEA